METIRILREYYLSRLSIGLRQQGQDLPYTLCGYNPVFRFQINRLEHGTSFPRLSPWISCRYGSFPALQPVNAEPVDPLKGI